MTRVLVLGGSGMLGHTLVELLAERPELEVHATVRDPAAVGGRVGALSGARLRAGVEASRFETVERALAAVRPAVVVNAIGLVKQHPLATDPVALIEVNALFPHRLAGRCREAGIRLVHISTDCVFSGARGMYAEADAPDPVDPYGRSKLLGEPTDGATLTLRTSLIGHERRTGYGLLDWFLAQDEPVAGYRHAVFSGLPTVELASVLVEHILPRPDLAGLYHVSAAPVSKLDLLELVAERYGRPTVLVAQDEPRLDRSLDSGRFRAATGWQPPAWPALVDALHRDAVRRYGTRIMAPAAR